MTRVIVGSVDSVPPGTRQRVEVAGRAIVIFHVDGTFRALRDVCPHQGAELSGGTVVRAMSAEQPGCYELDETRILVRCPWHGWEYDLATGQSWCDPVRAETIPIAVEEDYLVVDLDARVEAPS
jgi:nitrite reductase/ring-hydroxylating ferredoxin subunit